MKLTVTEVEIAKARRHIERREATAEIAQLMGVPRREIRRAASVMTTERIRKWLAFEQRHVNRATKPVQAAVATRPQVCVIGGV